MKRAFTIFLLSITPLLLIGCCCTTNDTCYNSYRAPEPYCLQSMYNDENCCDDAGYCSRPYLWEHY